MPQPYTKHQSLAPEEIELNICYTLTFNPARQHGSFMKDYRELQKIAKLFAFCRGVEFTAHPEYSKLGRLHMHGLVMFKEAIGVMEFYEKLPTAMKLSTFEMDTIQDGTKWLQYTMKQKSFMKPLCDENKVKYTIKNMNYQLTSKGYSL